jgi:hypothetical protein
LAAKGAKDAKSKADQLQFHTIHRNVIGDARADESRESVQVAPLGALGVLCGE